jgi:anaerobic C4-dicarboxylate transporter DcuB
VQLAERLLRKHPKYIVFLAPYCTWLLTMAVGTGHAVYMLQPIIADVAYKTRIRPERPMVVSSVASQMGITASPIAAAVTSFLALAMFAVSAFVQSQAATLLIMVPIGFVLNIPINPLIGMIPACYTYFFLLLSKRPFRHQL